METGLEAPSKIKEDYDAKIVGKKLIFVEILSVFLL